VFDCRRVSAAGRARAVYILRQSVVLQQSESDVQTVRLRRLRRQRESISDARGLPQKVLAYRSVVYVILRLMIRFRD